MRTKKIVMGVLILFVSALVSCGEKAEKLSLPDLTIKDIVVENWDDETNRYTATVTIENIGNAVARDFLVYIDAEGPGATSPIFKQYGRGIEVLNAGESIELFVDFETLPITQKPDLGGPNNFDEVTRLNVHVDAKGTVVESNETNNDRILVRADF